MRASEELMVSLVRLKRRCEVILAEENLGTVERSMVVAVRENLDGSAELLKSVLRGGSNGSHA